MYHIRILAAATRDLEKLDKPIARRISERIFWLGENLDNLKPDAFTGDLAGLYKLRVGDYRVIYEILYADKTIIIHQIDHRRQIYKRR